MIPFLMLLVGAGAGLIGGYLLGERRAKAAAADERATLRERALAAENALDTHVRAHAGQIKHAFDTAAVIVSECRNTLKTAGQTIADAVDLTKKAAYMILPPEIPDGNLTPGSVGEADRRVARERKQDRDTEERRSRA